MKRLLIFVVACLLAPVATLAQEEAGPTWTPTPHYLNPPSLPVKGPIVRRYPGQPGPEASMGWSSTPRNVGIPIAGYDFMMKPGPCARSVSAAILAHDDLFTGDKACDKQIRKARAIQRDKEAEFPAYAHGIRITPAPTPEESNNNGPKQ